LKFFSIPSRYRMHYFCSQYFTAMKIVLIGYMASGKSTLSKALSQAWGLKRLDLDQIIEEEEGKSIREIIFQKGELYFRKKERATLEKILKDDNFVLASGGGTPCYYENMNLINANSTSVYLKQTIPVLYNRLQKDRSDRPLLAHLIDEDLKEYIAKHLFERSQYYEQAILTLDAKKIGEDSYLSEMNRLLK
jgi:shikimate kinase